MATADLAGTWFPSGYYGHFRSKTRNDILQEYRHEASPLPPAQFVKWVRKSPDTHRFSNHDNRHSFPTDASYFDTGLGKRKGNLTVNAFNPNFMTWTTSKGASGRNGALSASLYRTDFQPAGTKPYEQMPQRLSPRIRRKKEEMEANNTRLNWTTNYKKQFCHGQPNPKINTDMRTGRVCAENDLTRSHQYINKTGELSKVVPPYLCTSRRTRSAPAVRFSVGDCLVWDSQPFPKTKMPVLLPQASNAVHTQQTPRSSTGKLGQQRQTFHQEKSHFPSVGLCSPKAKSEAHKHLNPAATGVTTFKPEQATKGTLALEHTLPSQFSKPTVIIN